MALEESSRVVASEAAVEPRQQEGGMCIEIGGEGAQGIAILDIGRDHPHRKRIALGIDHQHALPAFDLLVGVIPS